MLTQPQPSDVPTIYVVCTTGAGDGYEDYSIAIIPMTLDFCFYLLKLIGIAGVFKNTDKSFHRVTFFDYTLKYYCEWEPDGDYELSNEDYAEVVDSIDNAYWTSMPQGYRPPAEESRV